MAVFLTQDIENDKDNSYTDEVVKNIRSVPSGELLEVEICSGGGSTHQGSRIQRAVLEHEGPTKAIVIGLAASMSAKVLAAFDEVEIDYEARLMYHKAHIPEVHTSNYTDEQKNEIKVFNDTTYSLLLSKGVNKDFLHRVFKSDSTENHWISAKEAEELGIGKEVKIERRDSKPFKLAASLNINEIKNQYKEQMNLFKKEAPRMVNLADGRVLVFNSKKETLSKGDNVKLAGSDEKLTGKFKLENNLLAEFTEGEVVNMEEEHQGDTISREEFDDLKTTVEDIAKSIGAKKEEPSDEVKGQLTALKESEEKMENSQKELKDILGKVTDAIKNIKPEFKPEKIENKHEQKEDQEWYKNMSDSEKQAYNLRNVLEEEVKN